MKLNFKIMILCDNFMPYLFSDDNGGRRGTPFAHFQPKKIMKCAWVLWVLWEFGKKRSIKVLR